MAVRVPNPAMIASVNPTVLASVGTRAHDKQNSWFLARLIVSQPRSSTGTKAWQGNAGGIGCHDYSKPIEEWRFNATAEKQELGNPSFTFQQRWRIYGAVFARIPPRKIDDMCAALYGIE
jgi:hypothetical protein